MVVPPKDVSNDWDVANNCIIHSLASLFPSLDILPGSEPAVLNNKNTPKPNPEEDEKLINFKAIDFLHTFSKIIFKFNKMELFSKIKV